MTPRAASAIRSLRASAAQVPDRNLLAAVRAGGDEAAFEELVRRHGPMIFRVCLRSLGHRQDAEDAFQAVFVVLLRRVGRITKPDSLASWLHGVAFRVSQEFLAMRRRRQRAETARSGPAVAPSCPVEQADLAAWLDAALDNLPSRYRDAVVLCELEGRSRKEAARILGVPEGTVSSRLANARKLLAERLGERGLPAAALGTLLGAASATAMPVTLAERTIDILAAASIGSAVPGSVGQVADGVVKAMIVSKLKGVVAIGVALFGLVGLVALTGVPFGEIGRTAAAKPDSKQPADADALVRQLGDPKFARREEAQKRLRELGPKALPTLRAGAASKDKEVARRASEVMAAVRREQLWTVFTRIAGDDDAARDLFAQLAASPRAVMALEAALDNPSQTAELYRTRTSELMRIAGGHPAVGPDGKDEPLDVPDSPSAAPVPLGDVAGWLFLGALQPGNSAWRTVTHPGWVGRLSSVVPFLPEDDYTSAKPIHEAYTAAMAAPLKKLTAAWLLKRRENDGLRAGLSLAIRYDITDAVPAARRVLSDSKPLDIHAENLAAAAILLGLHGTKADLPLLLRHTADGREHETILNLPPGTDPGFAAPQTQDGRDLFCQVRDAAAVAMCKLAGKNPADFGFPSFPVTKHANGRPMSLSGATAVGFRAKADRTTAFEKAAAWLKSFEPPAPPAPKADPAVEKLVKQLGDADFRLREDAAKKLRDLGVKAIPALKAGTRDSSPEVSRRAREVLANVRADARDAFVKQFDPTKTDEHDHPVWKRFVVIAGDSRASRELIARIIANEKWFRTLDNAEADLAEAGHVYRVGIAEMFRDFDKDPANSPPWPCDRPEEVAYLFLLGSHADPNPPAKLTGDEVVPSNLRGTDFLGRGIIFGEGQIPHANGLPLGLEGKFRFNDPANAGAPGTDRVFAKLFAAWLAQRPPSANAVPMCFRVAALHRVAEILPIARRFAGGDLDPKKDVPPLITIMALEMIARHGSPADLPLFERHFGDETNVAAADKPRDGGGRDYFRPVPLKETTQLRDVALGLALLLHGANPEDFGFVVRKDTFKQKDGRYTIPWATQLHLGFDNAANRTAAFKKAQAWLDNQK
jgi:RNA polymerase sigma factor (sigma-70 family)